MTSFRLWLPGLLCWLGTLGPGAAQLTEMWQTGTTNPPAPANMIWDRDDLLARRPEAAHRLSAQLQKLQAECGFSIYLVVQSGLDSIGASEVAAVLQNQWVPDRNGLVVVCETDSGNVGFGKSYLTDFAFEGKIPSFEMAVVITQTMQAMERTRLDDAYLEELTGRLVRGVRDYVKRSAVPPPPLRMVRFGLFVLGAVAAFALAALLATWLLKTADERRRRFYYFSPVELPERLGAPFGGGSISSRQFRAAR